MDDTIVLNTFVGRRDAPKKRPNEKTEKVVQPKQVITVAKKVETTEPKNIPSVPSYKLRGEKKRGKTSSSAVHAGIVSSLFSTDSETPIIHKKKVSQLKEDVFASESFDTLQLHPFLVSILSSSFEVNILTTIQKATIPSIISKKDVLVKSQTGSGKTLAYAVPIVQVLQEVRPKIKRSDGVLCIVIVPTRELAIQSYECFSKILKSFTWIVPGYLMGGEKKKSEKSRIRKGINILVATPGRLLDHIQLTKSLLLDRVQFLVIDEADRLLDMGYEKDMAKIIEAVNDAQRENQVQTIMVSATLTPGVEQLAGLTLKNPEIIDVSTSENDDLFGQLVVPEGLNQQFIIVPAKLRLVTLAAFILWKCKLSEERKFLIFMSTQDMVDFHNEIYNKILKKVLWQDDEYLNDSADSEEFDDDESKIEFCRLHGNMSQKERTHVFLKFKDAASGVLICTDVAARGLDLPQVHWIVQYSAPSRPADYVHRVGRTARIGSQGNSLMFLLPTESGFLDVLVDENLSLEEMKINSVLENLPLVCQTFPSKKNTKKRVIGNGEEVATALQLRFENAVLSDSELQDMARKAFLSHVRAYASYPLSLRHLFNFKALHLGHLAKSMALRETPSAVGSRGSSFVKRHNQANFTSRRPEKAQKREMPRFKEMSEFASGLDLDDEPRNKRKRNKLQ